MIVHQPIRFVSLPTTILFLGTRLTPSRCASPWRSCCCLLSEKFFAGLKLRLLRISGMSRTKLVKIGPARPQFARRKRPKAGNSGKASGKNVKVKKWKNSSRKALPEMLNPETMPHIRLADIQTYERNNLFTRYPLLSYEVASYHEGLVKAGVAVRRCMLISKAAAVCQDLGLARTDIETKDYWVVSFLKNSVRLRDAIRKNGGLSRANEVCNCSCAPVAEKNSKKCFDPNLAGSDLTAQATPPPAEPTSNLFNLFLPSSTDESTPNGACSQLDASDGAPDQDAPSLANLFLSPIVSSTQLDEPVEEPATTCCVCTRSSTAPAEDWKSSVRGNELLAHSSTAPAEDWKSSVRGNEQPALKRGTKRAFSSDDEMQPLYLPKARKWCFPDPSFPELLSRSAMNKDSGYHCQPASDSDSDCSGPNDADELFLIFDAAR